MPPAMQDTGELPPQGVILPLDVVPSPLPARTTGIQNSVPNPRPKAYSPERQRDWVRLIVACGLLLTLGYLVVFATIEATSWPAHWAQTKEMLQIILPALTGVIGTVIGFYFGVTAVANGNNQSSNDSQ